MEALESILNSILAVFAASWWIIVPVFFGRVFWGFWLYYIRTRFVRNIKWVLLEISVPANIEKTPKAMEQIFAAMHGSYSFGFRPTQKYIKGMVEEWHSFELVGFAGGVYFYVRTPEGHRNLVESAIYAQYPNAEIHEVEDYLDLLPATLPNKVYDLWGADFILAKESPYPIRTYPEFEKGINTDEARIDPVANIVEVMSRLKEEEIMLFQFLIRPTGANWQKDGEALRDAIIGRKKPPAKSWFPDAGTFLRNLTVAPFSAPTWPEEKEQKGPATASMLALTPGERNAVEAIEMKTAKLGFETMIRFVYIDRRDSFTKAYISAVMGAFRQFNTQDLNAFRPDKETMTLTKGIFRDRKLYLRKRRLFDQYRLRRFSPRAPILNTEELATVYHYPSIAVKTPMLRRLTVRKGEPPAGLPVQ